MKSLNCCRLTIVDNYYLQNVIFYQRSGSQGGQGGELLAAGGGIGKAGARGVQGPEGDQGVRRPKRYGHPGDPGNVVERTRENQDPVQALGRSHSGRKEAEASGPPGHRLEQCLTPADWALGSGDRAPRSRSSGTRSPQRPRAPGCTERPRAVQERPPGRSNERPGDPGPQERIPPRRPAARVLNSPQDHQLPVFHRLLVGGAGFLLAG